MSDSRLPLALPNEFGLETPSSERDGSGRPASEALAAGKMPRVFGRYRLLDCLGRGGMGAVFKAHDPELDRTVALKVPFLHSKDAGLRDRFYREARAAATLQHANICPVFDVGEFEGVPYLTMAFIEGRSLAQAIEARQSFTPQQIAVLVRKLALAMQEAHAHGVIHRDLKPSNVLLRANGEPLIADFGLARRTDDTRSAGLTRQGDFIGTLEYMAPEQLEGDHAAVGKPADVYALGVILYECLTGRRPFAGNSASTVAAILLKPPTPPSEIRHGVPAGLEAICAKAMAKKPADRYASMAQLAAALADFLRSPQSAGSAAAMRAGDAPTPSPTAETRPIPSVAVPRDPGSGTPRAAPSSGRRPPKSGRRRAKAASPSYLPLYLGGGVLAVACVLGVAALAVKGSRPEAVAAKPPEPPPPPPADRVAAPPPAPAPEPAKPEPPPKAEPKPKPEPAALALHFKSEAVDLAVGEKREINVRVERRGYKGPITLRWSGPKEVSVSPAGSVTVRPGDPDPVLTLRPLAEPSGENPGLEIVAAPTQDPQRGSAASRISLRVAPGPCARVLEVTERPETEVTAMALAPDASLALVGCSTKSGAVVGENTPEKLNGVRAWNLVRGEALAPLAGSGRVTGLAVSGDGQTAMVVGADESVSLWNLARGRRELQSPKQALRVQGAAMSPDAKRGLVVYPGLVLKVMLERFQAVGQPIKTAQLTGTNLDDAIRAVAVSADKKGLVGGAGGKLFLIDMADKAKPKPLEAHHETVRCAAFAPDGTRAATGGGGVHQLGTLQPGRENAVCLWDVSAAALTWRADGHTAPVVSVAFAPDGRLLATGASNGEVRVWSADDGKPVATFTGHAGRVLALAFTPDGKALWTGAADRTLRQWRMP